MCNCSNYTNDFNNQSVTDKTPGPNCNYPCRCVRETVNEIVELCNAACVLDIFVFKTGYQLFENEGMRGVTVNCGICVKYTDCKGCRKTAIKDVTVIFCNVPCNIIKNLDIQICNPPKTHFCNSAVAVEFTVKLCEGTPLYGHETRWDKD
ncbi:MAG: hypothetical protein PHY15_01675 [Eubacteriales bacterium]|nr:hypothetical protein [Eubacteriales bacterium]MDD4475602.1 hypothetical protein [Eubacteriales bacterium]